MAAEGARLALEAAVQERERVARSLQEVEERARRDKERVDRAKEQVKKRKLDLLPLPCTPSPPQHAPCLTHPTPVHTRACAGGEGEGGAAATGAESTGGPPMVRP